MIALVGKQNPAIAIWLGGMLVLANVYFGSRARISRSISHILNSKPIQFLGRISYCLYLLHLPALIFARQMIHWIAPDLSAPALQTTLIAGGMFLGLAGSWLLHAMVEQPMIALGKQVTKPWKRRVLESAPVTTASAA